MKKITFRQQVTIGAALIILGHVLATVFHKGWFINIAWGIYGILAIVNPVCPAIYAADERGAKIGSRIAGAICLLVCFLVKNGV